MAGLFVSTHIFFWVARMEHVTNLYLGKVSTFIDLLQFLSRVAICNKTCVVLLQLSGSFVATIGRLETPIQESQTLIVDNLQAR